VPQPTRSAATKSAGKAIVEENTMRSRMTAARARAVPAQRPRREVPEKPGRAARTRGSSNGLRLSATRCGGRGCPGSIRG
jgi:hypothetical protein